MTNIILIAFAIFALWVLSLWAHPFGRCPKCKGKRMVFKGSKRRSRPRPCRKCKGVGRRQRPGSRLLHRTARRVRRELARQRKTRQQIAREAQP